VSQFAGKQVTGDYDKTSDPNKSHWVILGDNRGGLLVEEMDEQFDADKFWWSDCVTDHKGHTTLPKLAIPITPPTFPALTITNADFELNSGWTIESGASAAQSNEQNHTSEGTYSWKLDNNTVVYQDLVTAEAWDNKYRGCYFSWKCWVYSGVGAQIKIDDGATTTPSAAHSGVAGWEQLTASVYLGSDASRLRIELDDNNGATYFDDATISVEPTVGTSHQFANFNGVLYTFSGNVLFKLNSERTALTVVRSFPATIAKIIPSLNSMLYIFLGDTTVYQYMDVDEAFFVTDVNDATYSVQWDAKLWKMDADGNWWYTATPNSTTPSWTSRNGITDIASQIETLFVGKDASGDDVIYCATNSNLKVWDFTNNKWLNSALKLPNHPNGGKGATYWNDGHYISYGLGVKRYETGTEAQISDVGLNLKDGIPVEYNGEIVKLLGEAASNDMFALVDSSQTSGNSLSTVQAYNGRAWRCWWADTANNGAMLDAIVSSASSGYALYWGSGILVYYIDLPRGVLNPNQVSGQTFGIAGVHVSPWFDADWQVGNKVASRLRVEVQGDVSADETVIVRYRINHATTALAATWTPLGTSPYKIVAAGETEYTFGSSAGIAFRSIQFRFELARAGASTTETPDIVYATLEYIKVLPKKWGWDFTVDCTKPYNNLSPEQLLDALITAAETETLLTFMYEDVTKYVQVKDVVGSRLTGEGLKGEYKVSVVEV